MRWVWLGLVSSLMGCGPRVQPRYASWDPVRSDIPRSASRAEARARLGASYALWRKWRDPNPLGIMQINPLPDRYVYERAVQTSPSQVGFTLFVVQGGRVAVRAFMTADPRKLSVGAGRAGPPHVTSRWVEHGAQVGAHEEGAPAKTVDQLYAECSRLIEQGDPLPRLYFEAGGLLMQCGVPAEECSSCESASMLWVSRYSLREVPPGDPAAWLCETESALIAPGNQSPFLASEYVCAAAEPPRPPGPPLESTADSGAICATDPNACAPPRPAAAWLQESPDTCPSGPEHTPLALDVGKSDPLAEWRFPFSSSPQIECSGGLRLRNIRPDP